MTCTALMAGVDVGKTFLDLDFHPTGKPVRSNNGEGGIASLIALLKKLEVTCVALGAIGPYAQRLVVGLVAAGVAVFAHAVRPTRPFTEVFAFPRPIDGGQRTSGPSADRHRV